MKKFVLVAFAVMLFGSCKKDCDTYYLNRDGDCISFASQFIGQWVPEADGACSNGTSFLPVLDLKDTGAPNLIAYLDSYQLVIESETVAAGGPWTFSGGDDPESLRVQLTYRPPVDNGTNTLGQAIPKTPESMSISLWINEGLNDSNYCSATLVRP